MGEARLAMTPVRFTCAGDDGLPGFGNENPFANAFDVTATSFATMICFVLLVRGGIAPRALLILVVVLALRSSAAKGLGAWWSKGSS